MKSKFIKIFSFVSLMCSILALVIVINVNNDKTEVGEQGDLVVNTVNKNDAIQLRALQNVQSGVTKVIVTATVDPEIAADATLTWTLTWKTSKSDSVGNYVSHEVSSDTLSVELTYLKQFDTQIILTAKSNQTPSVMATCTIDCYTRSVASNPVIKVNNSTYTVSNGELDLTQFTIQQIIGSSATQVRGELVPDLESSTYSSISKGTLDTTQKLTVNMSLSNDLCDALDNAGITYTNNEQSAATIKLSYFGGALQSFGLVSALGVWKTGAKNVLANCQNWYTVNWTITDSYNGEVVNTITGSFDVLFDASDFLVVNSVTLDKTSFIF